MAMTNKTTDPVAMTVRQLRARRRRLVRSMPEVEGLISGSVVEQGRRCGKEGCRCARGELHGPYTYVVLPRVEGRTRSVYVPAATAEAVRQGAAVSAQVRDALEEISAINIELLSRGALG
jgi:transposase